MQPAAPPPSTSHSRMLCIVLSFNGVADTVHCLDSIYSQDAPRFDVLVVDNGSQPGVVDQLCTRFPDVEILALTENLGWAGGNNVGIKLGLERGYEWICLLNNDLVFPDGSVAKWLDATVGLPPCLLHPTIYFWDEPTVAQVEREAGARPAFSAPELSSKVVLSYAYGACLAVHRTIFEKVGVFDERFFLQLEETDFHLRSEQAGFLPVCATDVHIFHKESRAFGGTMAPIKTYYATRNRMLLTHKNRRGLLAKWRAWRALYWTISQVADSTEQGKPLGRLAFFAWIFSGAPRAVAFRFGMRDYFKSRFGRISPERHAALKVSEAKFEKRLEQKNH